MSNLLRDFIIAAGGAFGGGLVVLAGQEAISYFRTPNISLSFDRNKHRAVVITVQPIAKIHPAAFGQALISDCTFLMKAGSPQQNPARWQSKK